MYLYMYEDIRNPREHNSSILNGSYGPGKEYWESVLKYSYITELVKHRWQVWIVTQTILNYDFKSN